MSEAAFWKTVVWSQFGAAIDMLENAILACPEDLWSDRSQRPEYWYVVFHTLFFSTFTCPKHRKVSRLRSRSRSTSWIRRG